MKKIKYLIGIFLITFTISCFSQAQNMSSKSVSVKNFVQSFYNWYVPKMHVYNKGPAWELVLKYKSSILDSKLARALKEDLDAQNLVEGEIVGLDFDPFLSSQDPCSYYEIGQISSKSSGYWVEVYAVCSGKKRAKADVMVEVIWKDDHWLISNLRYPDNEDLLSLLKSYQEDYPKRK